MKIIVYPTVNKFLEENESILLDKESASQLILFNAISKQTEETSDVQIFGKVIHDNNEVILLFSNVLPYNLVIHATQSDFPQESIIYLADYFRKNKILIKGVIANKTICDLFMHQYKRKYKEYLAMDIMELRKIKEFTMPFGETRKATRSESGLIAQWIVEFAKEALGEEIQYEDQIKKAERMIDAQIVYIYVNPNSTVVSMAAATRQLIHGVCINSVYTPKKYRGKGYAAANMYYMSKNLLEKGNQFCTLFVDKHNPVSNRVYEKVGYEIIEDQYDYRFI